MALRRGPDPRWSLDLVSDTLIAWVSREIDAVIARQSRRLIIVRDSGTELASVAIRAGRGSTISSVMHRTRQTADFVEISMDNGATSC